MSFTGGVKLKTPPVSKQYLDAVCVCVCMGGGAMVLIHRLDHIRKHGRTGTLIIMKQIDDYQNRKN